MPLEIRDMAGLVLRTDSGSFYTSMSLLCNKCHQELSHAKNVQPRHIWDQIGMFKAGEPAKDRLEIEAASQEIPGVPYVFCDVSVHKAQEMRPRGWHSLRTNVQSVAKSVDPEVLLTFISARGMASDAGLESSVLYVPENDVTALSLEIPGWKTQD